jgi:hypothetical protein
MVHCAVEIDGLGGTEVTFVSVPMKGDEVDVPMNGVSHLCRVEKVRHFGASALPNQPQPGLEPAVMIFVSRV